MRIHSLLPIALALAACAKTAAPPPRALAALEGERERASYLVGLDAARQVAPVKDEIDVEIALQAMRDALAGRAPLLDEAAQKTVRAELTARLGAKRLAEHQALAARNLEQAERALAANAKRDGVVTLPSGLQYEVLRAGHGATPRANDTVRVNYLGSLADGTVFESTYATDHPAEFVVGRVMPGLSEAIVQMQAGAKMKAWVAPKLAYGENGVPGQIEPNALLTFEIELLEIAPAR